MTPPDKRWSEEDQRKHIAELKAANLQQKQEVNKRIEKLLSLLEEFDPLDLLAKLACYQLFGDPSLTEKGAPERSESQVEYLQSLILARPYPVKSRWPESGVVQACIDLVNEIMM